MGAGRVRTCQTQYVDVLQNVAVLIPVKRAATAADVHRLPRFELLEDRADPFGADLYFRDTRPIQVAKGCADAQEACSKEAGWKY